ncbi:MAG TPA: hypothetical protein VNE41_00150 [Chitinophagaceae bacterium]|nr:hypothetical protein [Chitinophagaceae bacterium]
MNRGKRITIRDYHTMELEKLRLKSECRMLEKELETRATYLKDHYGSMALHSVFPKGSITMESVAGKARNLISGIWGNTPAGSFASGAMRKGVQMLIARQLVRLITGRKKSKKKD